jgi:hypothetical protein
MRETEKTHPNNHNAASEHSWVSATSFRVEGRCPGWNRAAAPTAPEGGLRSASCTWQGEGVAVSPHPATAKGAPVWSETAHRRGGMFIRPP